MTGLPTPQPWHEALRSLHTGWAERMTETRKLVVDVGVLQWNTVFYLSSEITCHNTCSWKVWLILYTTLLNKQHKTGCGTLHKTFKWLLKASEMNMDLDIKPAEL